MRHTADSAALSGTTRLAPRTIERIATSRALQREPLDRFFSYVPQAVSIEPGLGPRLATALSLARNRADAFGERIDRILATIRREPDDGTVIEGLARRAMEAQIDLWRAGRAEADRLVSARLDAQIKHRRLIVAVALLAVFFGALAIAFVIRYLARNDRIELAAAKLESDKLRTQLQQISTERALRLQEAQFRSVFENADLGIVIFDLTGAISQHNGAVEAMLGKRMATILADRLPQIHSFRADREPFTNEELHVREDGSAQWLALTFSGVYDDGTCQMVILLVRDTTEEKLLHDGLLHAASHDGLTQIANRTAFESRLEALFAADEPFALMYVDLDKFKPVNDRFGHAAGDHVLVTTADRLRSALASTDFCARLGGDEFAALVRGNLTTATLMSIAARVNSSLAGPVKVGDDDLEVTASIGIAVHRSGEGSAAELKSVADRALYRAKAGGGNGARLGTPLADPIPA